MNKEEAREEFLKSLRVAISNNSVYFKEHPMVSRAIEDLRRKTEAFMGFVDPIRIGITPDILFFEGEYLEDTRLHKELAEVFHLRKVKTIEIRKGITFHELGVFIRDISLPSKEIIKEGGVLSKLARDGVKCVSIEELDYSGLLAAEGEEYKEIWSYLFGQVIEKNNISEINEFVNNFGKILGQFRNKDFLENDALRENILKFLNYLKSIEQDKFSKCAKETVKSILKDKSVLEDVKLDNLKVFFKHLDPSSLADVLWEEAATNDNFDHTSFSLFLRMIDKDAQGEVTSAFLEKTEREYGFGVNLKTKKKIRELFFSPDTAPIIDKYGPAFSNFLKHISFEGGLFFSKDGLLKNYRLTLLNLVAEASTTNKLEALLECIVRDWEAILEEKDFTFVKNLFTVLQEKSLNGISCKEISDDLESRLTRQVEDMAMAAKLDSSTAYILDFLKHSVYDFDFYANAIFVEGKINPYVLRLYFKFFSSCQPAFLKLIKAKIMYTGFLATVIENLGQVDSASSLDILKYIFLYSNSLLKRKTLEAMLNMSICDEEFLFFVLEKSYGNIKKTALTILIKNCRFRKKVAEKLLLAFNPFGIKNRVIIENIHFIDDLEAREAKDYLKALVKKSFWNPAVRKAAARVINKWNN